MARSPQKADSHCAPARLFRELSAFLDGLTLVGMIVDTRGRIIFANRQLLEVTHRVGTKVEGRNYFRTFIPPDIRSKLSAAYRRAMAAGFIPQETENDIVTRENERITISWHNVLNRRPGGDIAGMTCIGRKAAGNHADAGRMVRGWVSLDHVQEDERRQLAQVLHDSVGEQLVILGITLKLAKTAMESGDRSGAGKRLAESMGLAEGVATRIRDVMEDLRPRVLDDYGLLPALRWYARSFSRRTGVRVSFPGGEPARRPSPEVESMLFRIVLEALTNVAKHAHARNVEISMTVRGGITKLSVADDGVGFKLVDAGRSGRGLEIMRERAASIGGMLEIASSRGGGTTVSVLVRR